MKRLKIKKIFMKITIIYDNTAFNPKLEADWGFSALIEPEWPDAPKILFDTGAKGEILMKNLEKLNIDPGSIDEIFISHDHRDHTGGLSEFLKENKKVKAWIPPSVVPAVLDKDKTTILDKPTKLHENIFSTGELDGIEQALCVQTDKGIVIVVGCSHPSMKRILNTASEFGKIYAIIGGLHGFDQYEIFEDLELICPTHCTEHKKEIQRKYPEQYLEGGAGRIINI